jgi:hypothetical protein
MKKPCSRDCASKSSVICAALSSSPLHMAIGVTHLWVFSLKPPTSFNFMLGVDHCEILALDPPPHRFLVRRELIQLIVDFFPH